MTVLRGLRDRLRTARLGLVADLPPASDEPEPHPAAGDAEHLSTPGDPARPPTSGDRLLPGALAGGIDLLLLRGAGGDPEGGREAVRRVRRSVPAARVLLGFDDPGRCVAVGADLCHLGPDHETALARQLVGPHVLLGRTSHDRDQLRAAVEDPDLDYFFLGPVWATPGEPEVDPVGLELLAEAARRCPPHDRAGLPWFATGGIDLDRLEQVLAAGARRVVVGPVVTGAGDLGAGDPRAAAAALAGRLRRCWREDPRLAASGFALRR